MPPNKDEFLKVRISGDLKREAASVADDLDEAMAVVVRDALRDYIDRHKEKVRETRLVEAPVAYRTAEVVKELPFPFAELDTSTVRFILAEDDGSRFAGTGMILIDERSGGFVVSIAAKKFDDGRERTAVNSAFVLPASAVRGIIRAQPDASFDFICIHPSE